MSGKSSVFLFISAAALAIPLFDPLTRARFLNEFVINLGFPILILFVGIVLAMLLGRESGAVFGVILSLTLGGLVLYAVVREHQSQLYYATTIEETDKPLPTFGDRAPHQVAARQATSNLSDINGTPGRTAFVPADGGRYTTLVSKLGVFNPGYVAVGSQEIALTGQAKGETCLFDERSNKRMDGFFNYSLTRAIAAEDAFLYAKGGDAWGYCDGETPKVVVPVTKLTGWVIPHHVPAGIAVYDGDSGEVEILDGDDVADLPGPTVPIRCSEYVNSSLATLDGNWWTKFWKQTGLTDEVKDSDDPNSLNASNFTLSQGDGSVYVSPFTSRAASVTIDAVAVLDASHSEAGEAPKVTLHRLETPRASNAATADRIKADYASLPGWATGLVIQEIVPAGKGQWAASIGLNQNVTHRVLVRDDGSSCLQDAKGNKISCTDDPIDGAPAPGDQPAVGIPADISALNNEQLAQLQEAVTGEVLRRLQQP